MKVILISPNFFNMTRVKEETSLGLLYLATEIQDICEVKVIDAPLEDKEDQEIINEIEKIDPEIVGISVNFANALNSAKKIAKRLKNNNFKGFLILGGNTSTFLYEQLLTKNYADIIVLHEGETTFKELLTTVKKYFSNKSSLWEELSRIKGIAFKNGNNLVVTDKRDSIKDLDSIKIPERDYLDNYYQNTNTISIISSRGCPYNCYYCSTNAMWKNWRSRSAKNIVAEIEYIKKKYPNINHFSFVDDNFLVNRKRAEEFAQLLLAKKLDINFDFLTRIEHVNEDILKTLKKVGLTNMFFGVESGSPRILKLLNRHYTPNEVIKKTKYAENLGIKITASFIIGFPWEEEKDIRETLDLIDQTPSTYTQVHICTPYPGTPFFESAKEFGITLHIKDLSEIKQDEEVYMETKYLKAADILSWYKKAVSDILKKQYIQKIKKS